MADKSVRYAPEFKRQMVDLVRSGRSPASLAKEFGPTAWTIALWARQAKRDAGKGDGGLTTAEIARAFLVPEPTVPERIVRAKRTLSERQIPFEAPRGNQLAARLSSELEVIYLVFKEGDAAQ